MTENAELPKESHKRKEKTNDVEGIINLNARKEKMNLNNSAEGGRIQM